jgi:hypothetical protein
MERINYSQIIQDILSNHSTNDTANGTEIQLLFDTQRHYYQVLNIGWKQQIRTYGVIIHVDIKDDKIWIQRDGTEIGIANELIAVGVPKEDIVLGFHAPYKRQFTGFAVG